MSQQLLLTDAALGEAQLALEESEREVDELRESGRQRTVVLEQTVGELYAVRGEERDAQIEALIAEVTLYPCFRFAVSNFFVPSPCRVLASLLISKIQDPEIAIHPPTHFLTLSVPSHSLPSPPSNSPPLTP